MPNSYASASLYPHHPEMVNNHLVMGGWVPCFLPYASGLARKEVRLKLELFTSKIPEVLVKAKVREGSKEVRTEKRAPKQTDVEAHLDGDEALGIPIDRAICLDLDYNTPKTLGPLISALKGLGLAPYWGPGTTRGSRVWLFLEGGDAEAHAKTLAKLAQALGYSPCEPYPNGGKPIILPFFGEGFPFGDSRPLYGPDGKPVHYQDFTPIRAKEEELQAVSQAVGLFLTALQRRPNSRHDTAMAFLNLAARMGVAEKLAVLMGTEAFFKAWGLDDGTRTLEAWRAELERLVEAAKDPTHEAKRGVPFLQEAGYILPEAVVEVLDPWPTPQPLDEALGLPDLPQDRLLVPEEVHLLAESMAGQLALNRAPIALAAMAVISGVAASKGLVIQPNPINPAWEEAPVLWVVMIGPSGSGKTPVLREVGKPVWELERTLAEENQALQAEFEAELQAWSSKKKGERGPRPVPPPKRRLVVTDTTPEALAEILSQNPGVLSIQDELKGLLASWAREDRTEGRALYLSAYTGHAFVVDRKTQGTIYLERPMVALLGGIQPGPWNLIVQSAQGLNNNADGLLQRVTPLLLTPGQPLRDPPPIDLKVLKAYRDLVHRLFELEGGVMAMSQDALGLWREWEYECRVEARKDEHPDSWRGYLSKRAGLSARLAGLIALAKGEKEISRTSLIQAITLTLEVLEPHAKAAWRIEETEQAKTAKRLLHQIITRGVKEFTTREVYTGKWAGITTAEEARETLRLLEARGWVRYRPDTRGWQVNPKAKEVGHAD